MTIDQQVDQYYEQCNLVSEIEPDFLLFTDGSGNDAEKTNFKTIGYASRVIDCRCQQMYKSFGGELLQNCKASIYRAELSAVLQGLRLIAGTPSFQDWQTCQELSVVCFIDNLSVVKGINYHNTPKKTELDLWYAFDFYRERCKTIVAEHILRDTDEIQNQCDVDASAFKDITKGYFQSTD